MNEWIRFELNSIELFSNVDSLMHNDAFYLKKSCRIYEKGQNRGINRVLKLFLLKIKN